MLMNQLPLTIPANHPAYAGHFPGQPITPGVVLLDETLFVLGEALAIAPGKLLLHTVKFISPHRPGEPLTVHYEMKSQDKVHFEIMAEDRVIAIGSYSAKP